MRRTFFAMVSRTYPVFAKLFPRFPEIACARWRRPLFPVFTLPEAVSEKRFFAARFGLNLYRFPPFLIVLRDIKRTCGRHVRIAQGSTDDVSKPSTDREAMLVSRCTSSRLLMLQFLNRIVTFLFLFSYP